LRIQTKLDSEPTENLIFRNKILTLETENTLLKKRLAELEKEVKHKQQTINTIVQIVNKVSKVEPELTEPELEPALEHALEPEPEPVKEVKVKKMKVQKEPEPNEPEKIIKHNFVEKPYPKTKNKQRTYCLETFINLRLEDVDFCVECEYIESDILEIDKIRSYLDDVRREHTWTKDKILGIYEQVFNEQSTPQIQKWKIQMEESTLSRIKTFLRLSDNPCG
jgi:Asp-tRNA(Asn)/Glu-tRNA(Gln) amidotransferase C subunit